MITPTVADLLADPCTPFWAKDAIRVALTKDPVDAANVFATLARAFAAHVPSAFAPAFANNAVQAQRDARKARA